LFVGYSLEQRLADALFLQDHDEIRTLLALGASPEVRDDERRTALILAVSSGDAELARLLLDAGADVAARDRDGRTALHVAAQCRDLTLAWLLLQHGAPVNAIDDDGASVLWRAILVCAGHTEVVELLRRLGARDDTPGPGGLTPGEVARRLGVALGPTRAHQAQ
jgi:ankyrin repeat protein